MTLGMARLSRRGSATPVHAERWPLHIDGQDGVATGSAAATARKHAAGAWGLLDTLHTQVKLASLRGTNGAETLLCRGGKVARLLGLREYRAGVSKAALASVTSQPQPATGRTLRGWPGARGPGWARPAHGSITVA